jgi:membrane-associated progesterone receptor component
MWRSAAKAAGGLVGGTAVLGFAADYATMSPFRRDWRVGDALLVGYNQLLRRTPAGDVLLQEFDLAELSAFSGRAGAPTYLSAGGCVWDVSSSRDSFGIGGPYEIFAGRDASVALAYMRIEERDANCVDQFATLRADPEAAESLESWRTYFDQKYRRVGVLREWVRQEPNLTGTARRCLQRNASRPAVTVLPSGVQYETLAAAQTARAGAGTTVGRGLSRGAQDMVLAHYCVRGVDGTVVSDSASVEDGRPLILAVRDLPPVRTTLPHDCSRRMQHGRRLDLPV